MDVLSVQFDPNSVKVAWDGSRIVTICGKERSLNALAAKIAKVAACADTVDQLTVGQRLDGIRAAKLIGEAYLKTDQMIKRENILFRGFVWMKEGFFALLSSNARGLIEKRTVIQGLRSYDGGRSARLYASEDCLEALNRKLTFQKNFE